VSDRVSSTGSRVAAIVLAAGMSRRMGQPKALLPMGDELLIRRVVRNLIESESLSYILVVTGHQRDAIEAALCDLDVTFIHNPDYDAGGMLSSIQVGIRAVPAEADAALITLGDQPLVEPATIRAIIMRSESTVVIPSYQSKRGHPVLIARSHFEQVLALGPEQTLKNFMSQQTSAFELPVDDPAVVADIDTQEDYQHALKSMSSTREGQAHV
jgi:molybdenum cofactor cytidylyltransferase